jgi:uncharacterized iron-regulated membrane protein
MIYLRALLLRIHVILGLIGGLFFAIFGLTGAAMAFRPQIEASLYWPHTSAPAVAGASLDAAVQKQLAAHPDMKVREVNLRAGHVWDIVLHRRDGSAARSVYVDPGSGSVLHEREHADSFLDRLYHLHTELLLGRFGLQIVVRLALLLMVQAVVGLAVWHLRGYPFHSHAVLGVTAGLVAGLMAYSGWRILTVPSPSVAPVITLWGAENRASIDQLVETASKRRPGGTIAAIYFPQAPSQPFQFWFGQRPADGIVYMDPYGTVIPMMVGPSRNVALDWHSGPAGGSLMQAVRAFTGLGLAGLFLTGLYRRFRRS